MALEQVLRQEVKQLKSALKNGVKRSKISLAGNDDKKYQLSQVNYFADKVKNTHIITPYGLASNPSENEELLTFNVMGQEENTAGIPYAVTKRFKNLAKGEVKTGNPLSNSSVLFRNDGVSEINGSEFEGLVKIIDLTTKLNALVTDYNLHTHSGVQTGAGTSGVPTATTNTFSKSDYENTNVVHGKEGTGTSGSSSGSGAGINDHSLLINLDYASSGHIGFEKSLTFSTGLTRVGDTISVNIGSIPHNDLSGKQGGTTGQYYHLTSAEYSALHSAVTVLDTASIDFTLTGQQISAVVIPAGIDHNLLLNYEANRHFLQSDITQISSSISNGILTTSGGALGSITDNSTNWNTAYGWGDHSVEGYLKNIVEDTTPQLGGTLDSQEYDLTKLGDLSHNDATASDWVFRNYNLDKYTRFFGNYGGSDLELLTFNHSNSKIGISKNNPSERLDIFSGHINFERESQPTALTATLGTGAGNVDDGDHRYLVEYVTSSGKTGQNFNYSNTVTVVDKTINGKIELTNIPTSSSPYVTARNIYRSKAGDSPVNLYLLTTINDNVTTTYTDNISDSSLGVNIYRAENTTGGIIYLDNNQILGVGSYNTFFGNRALENNTTGNSLVAIGTDALLSNTSGNINVSIGYLALSSNTNGNANTAVGYASLLNNINGENNTAFGTNSGRSFAIGANRNTAIGSGSAQGLSGSDSGDDNSALGFSSGSNLKSGSRNTLLGSYAGDVIQSGNDNIIIGYGIDPSSSSASNELNIGDLIYGNLSTNKIGIGVIPTQPLDINGNNIRIRNSKTPSSASDTGETGQIAWDSSYFYICTGTNTWRRIQHATW